MFLEGPLNEIDNFSFPGLKILPCPGKEVVSFPFPFSFSSSFSLLLFFLIPCGPRALEIFPITVSSAAVDEVDVNPIAEDLFLPFFEGERAIAGGKGPTLTVLVMVVIAIDLGTLEPDPTLLEGVKLPELISLWGEIRGDEG